MLDYMLVDPVQLAEMVHELALQLHVAVKLCVAVVTDCCLVVNAAALPQAAPMFICFAPGTSGGGLAAQWASKSESSDTWQQLQRVREALLAPQSASVDAHRLPIVHLHQLPACPCMPTVNGYLLGYPAVYVVHDLEEAQAASRCLSATTLCLHTVQAQLSLPSKGASVGKLDSAGSSLLAFSVPAQLCGSSAWVAALQAWQQGMQARRGLAVQSGYVPWGAVRLEQTSCMRGIAL